MSRFTRDTSPTRAQLRAGDRRTTWRRGTIRRVVAAVLAAAAVYAGLSAVTPDEPDPGPQVLVAGRDLPVGAVLEAGSMRLVHVPEDLVPAGALREESQVEGRVATSPIRDGEIVTDVRVSPESLLHGLDPGLVLAHLPLADLALATTLQPGARVDVLGTLDGSVLAQDVLLVQRVADHEAGGAAFGAAADPSFLVAVTPEQASRLAAATGTGLPGDGLTVVIRGSS